MIDKTKARIQELVPDLKIETQWHGDRWLSITLAVVLRAILEAATPGILLGLHGDKTVSIQNENDGEYCCWNLAKDDYDDQTQEMKDFIGKLLGI